MFYTYVHFKPVNIPFYVGKGKGNRCEIDAGRNIYYERIVNKYGAENIEIRIIDQESEKAAFAYEKELIKLYREMGYELANLTDGGEGQSNPTPETRAKIAKGGLKRIGLKRTEETKKRMSIAQRALNKTFQHTEEAKRKIAEAGRGRKLSPEHQAALINSLIGHPYWPAKTPEARARQTETRRGVKNTPEHNAKISASKMGHAVSQEQREKQRQKMLGRKQSPEAKAKQISAQKGRIPKSAVKEGQKLPEFWIKNAQRGLLKYFEEKRKRGESLKQSPELIEKRRQGMLKHYAKLREQGKKRSFSEESKAKMSVSQKAYNDKQKALGIKRPVSQKLVDAVVARNKANKGKKHSLEHNAKIQAALKNKRKSPEHVAAAVEARRIAKAARLASQSQS